MTKTAATTGTTRLRLARIICMVSSLGISRAGAIVPETKTQEVFQPGSSYVHSTAAPKFYQFKSTLLVKQMQILL